ncbi:MAG: hypothetical protein QM804_09340 [Propionicimonas sp.]
MDIAKGDRGREKQRLGFVLGPDGGFAEPWGTPKPVEAVDDLRQAWLEPHGR